MTTATDTGPRTHHTNCSASHHEPGERLMQPQPRTAHLLSPAPSWHHTPPNIVDPFADLLALLGEPKRRGMISWIAVRYYDGWRPGRERNR